QLGRRSGAMVLAIRNPETTDVRQLQYRGARVPSPHTSLIANPGGDVQLGPGQMLVVMGSQEQLRQFGRLLGPALADVGLMPA
ncbi:MAG: potassium channel protein, partial [Cyanobacteriota bacterium]|nr:potassium channel protein [Cyanobacteriota bacterium]